MRGWAATPWSLRAAGHRPAGRGWAPVRLLCLTSGPTPRGWRRPRPRWAPVCAVCALFGAHPIVGTGGWTSSRHIRGTTRPAPGRPRPWPHLAWPAGRWQGCARPERAGGAAEATPLWRRPQPVQQHAAQVERLHSQARQHPLAVRADAVLLRHHGGYALRLHEPAQLGRVVGAGLAADQHPEGRVARVALRERPHPASGELEREVLLRLPAHAVSDDRDRQHVVIGP